MMNHDGKLDWRTPATIVASALALALLTVSHAPAAPQAQVSIGEFKFSPPTLSVPVGTTVMWTNRDEVPHTITAATGAFASGGLSQGETFAQLFARPGTYEYFCSLHPHMRATVVVK